MKRLRFSGSAWPLTCSADTVVPRMTNRSTPASTTVFHSCWVRWGDSAPATVTPASRTWRSRSTISSGTMSAAYSSCIRLVACAGSSEAISASSGSGSSYRVQRPSRSSTPRPPSSPRAIAVAGDITESIGAASTGRSKW